MNEQASDGIYVYPNITNVDVVLLWTRRVLERVVKKKAASDIVQTQGLVSSRSFPKSDQKQKRRLNKKETSKCSRANAKKKAYHFLLDQYIMWSWVEMLRIAVNNKLGVDGIHLHQQEFNVKK